MNAPRKLADRSRPAVPHVAVSRASKTYGRGVRTVEAIKEASLVVGANEFLSIVGSSGCGKSTLLMMIAGLARPSAGSVTIMGSNVEGPRRDSGIVFQSSVLLPWRTILDNVLLPIEMMGEDVGDYIAKAENLLAVAGIADFKDHLPRELSGGMQQRASICRALIHEPALLLMDEPFSALDALTRDDMNLELLRIWERYRKTVIFVTHSIREAVFLSDRVVVMSPRPSVLRDDVEIPLARPRTLEMQDTEEFGELCARIRSLIRK